MKSKVKDPDRKVGFGKLVLWQSSSVSVALFTLVLGFVTIYCTDTLHLDPLMVGTLFMVSRIVDAITDTVVGVIIDRTNTRWGKGRPYEIFMLFLWLATWLLFSTPEGFSNKEQFRNRFYQHLSLFPDPDEEMASLNHQGLDDKVAFCLEHGAYSLTDGKVNSLFS